MRRASKRGLYTSFIQASVAGGFLLSLIVVLGTQAMVGDEAWAQWGWRIPFLFSLVLLAISLWMRLKLSESPVFVAMKAKGQLSHNPLKESFADRRNVKLIMVAMLGIAAGLTVIWYTAQFQTLYFLQNSLKVDETTSRLLVGASAVISLFWFILFGWLSDKVGRKKPIIIGYAATLLLLFPLFHMIADAGNPGLAEAGRRAPIVVAGPDCSFNPFATKGQATDCGKLLDYFSKKGVSYTKAEAATTGVSIGGKPVDGDRSRQPRRRARRGRLFDRHGPPAGQRDREDPVRPGRARLPLGDDLRPGRGAAGRDVPGQDPLQLDVDPLSYRHRLFRRFPAVHQPIYHRQDRRSLLGALVHVRGGGDGACSSL